MTQANDAAERSAHVSRGPARGCTVAPCVEVAPGQWKLRVLVDAEAEIARLRAELAACRAEDGAMGLGERGA